MLCGLEIDYHHGLSGHSDADVATHAVIDAVLGAAGLGDIGEQFPDSDPAWKDADSAALLGRVVALVARAGWAVTSVDVNVLIERPKLAPHKAAMRERLAGLLALAPDAVGLKARTMEGLGPIGDGTAVASHVVVMLCHV